MQTKILFFFSTIVFLFIFTLAGSRVIRGEGEPWQEWVMTSLAFGWFVFWALVFHKRK